MKRQIIHIDQELCIGCGLCISACQEGAIALIEGKATLIRDDYCDGLGNCLPVCPAGAISFEEREAAPFDPEAVKARDEKQTLTTLQPKPSGEKVTLMQQAPAKQVSTSGSERRQWPIQIKLTPVDAAFFEGAHLLVAADCSAFTYENFHRDFARNRVVLIGCPKLDSGDYTQKLTEIIKQNDIKSLQIVRMEVPCCGGLERSAVQALKESGKFIPWQIVTITSDGKVLENGSFG
jgi:ferredoxin